MSSPKLPDAPSTTVVDTLLDTAHISVLAGAMLLMGMSTGAFTKAGKGKKAGAKVGFTFTGLFLLAGTGMLIYVAIDILIKKKDSENKE